MIPIASISSDGVSLIPAVSVITTGTPLISIWAVNTSLVVPGILVTIALSVPDKAFSRLDLPALGAPDRTILAPSFNLIPCLAIWMVLAANCSIEFNSRSVFPDS